MAPNDRLNNIAKSSQPPMEIFISGVYNYKRNVHVNSELDKLTQRKDQSTFSCLFFVVFVPLCFLRFLFLASFIHYSHSIVLMGCHNENGSSRFDRFEKLKYIFKIEISKIFQNFAKILTNLNFPKCFWNKFKVSNKKLSF